MANKGVVGAASDRSRKSKREPVQKRDGVGRGGVRWKLEMAA